MPTPTDLDMYNKIKANVYKEIPKHSAYRSGIVVQKYKNEFAKRYPQKEPYIGEKPKKKGLTRWFNEKWVNQRGDIGYKNKNDIYRPSIRVTKKTPTTHNEISDKELARARREKYTKGRVKRFHAKVNRTRKLSAKKGGKTEDKTHSRKAYPTKRNGYYFFSDYPTFRPNLSPHEMFALGSFGGTYWRPIHSNVTKQQYKNVHHQYPSSWWKGIHENHLSDQTYDNEKNKYKVKVGTTLRFWEEKKWIKSSHPYGWVHWYCDFFMGKRSEDDERQIARWEALAGPRGRFMRFLVTLILKKGVEHWKDESISPKIRQVLQHWAYTLTKKDLDKEIERRRK
jgi:hypothetical protein